MTTSWPSTYERLLEDVVAALERDSVADARRHLLKARAGAREHPQLEGVIAAMDFVCDAFEDDAQRHENGIRDLQALASSQSPAFANGVGCALSDIGDRLNDVRWLETADAWFLRLAATEVDPILLANRGVVLERLGRFSDACLAFGETICTPPPATDVPTRMRELVAN